LPLVLPACVGALAYVSTVGPTGLLQDALAPFGVDRLPPIYGFAGSWLCLSLFSFPYALLATRTALRGMDPGQEEAGRSLGLSPVGAFFRVTLPQLRPAIAAGALFAALYSIGDFGVVTLMRYDALTRAIYVQYRSALDRASAASLALVLIVVSLGIIAVGIRLRGPEHLHRVSATTAREQRPLPLGRWRVAATAFCAIVVGLALVVPIGTLLFWALRSVFRGETFDNLALAGIHSLTVGAATAAVVAVAAIPVTVMIARYPGPLSTVTERLAYLGYAIPRIALALAFVTIGVRTPFYQTIALLIIACSVRFISQGIGPAKISLLQVNPRVEEAARGLGASQWSAIRRVLVPLAAPGLLIGAAMVMLNTMKERPLTLLLAPAGYDTLATAIWNASTDAAYGQASAAALLLVGLTVIPSLLLISRYEADR
ncbi:MAG: ABC transporter permease, partial [Chloroflexota bacterium]